MHVSQKGVMMKAVYDPDKNGRLGKDALEIALNKVLKGTGPGSDPVEIEPATISSGSYSGNDTANRAIAHGLGATPKVVFLISGGEWRALISGLGKVSYTDLGNTEAYTVTAPDSNNFYVGNATDYAKSGNGTGTTYYWVAIG